MTPIYAKLNVPSKNIREGNTKEAAQHIPIKNEKKFLYKKKLNLNVKVYKIYLENANEWNMATCRGKN